jgi:membrane-associated protease RseP (regulator of RpoE activity)
MDYSAARARRTTGSFTTPSPRPWRSRWIAATAILLAGALLPAEPNRGEELERLLSTRSLIRAERLHEHVQTLADDTLEGREAGSRGGRAAGAYLLQQFQASLDAAAGHLEVQSFGSGYRNLIGTLDGSDPLRRDEYILVGAHYDHVGYGTTQNSYGPIGLIHNGADDNASGTAAILMILEAFGQTDLLPSRSLLFVLWDAEEKGLLGSKYWIDHPTVPTNRLRLAINLDMIGRLRDQHVDVYGTRSMAGLRTLVSRANREIGLHLNFLWKMEPNGDHYTFFSRQVPVVMFHTGLHDQYHRPSDDADRINDAGLSTVAQLVFGTLVEAAEDPLSGFRLACQHEGERARQTFERPLPPPPPRLGISWTTAPGETGGLRVTSVRPASPADRAGIQVGDRIRQFAGEAMPDTVTLQRAVVRAEREVSLEILRGEDPLTIPVSLDGLPYRLGLSWRTNSAEPDTVTVIRVVRHSAADRAGLQWTDRIHRIGGKSFSDSREFAELAHALPLPLELLVERNGQFQTITLPADPVGRRAQEETTIPSTVDHEPDSSVAPDSPTDSDSKAGKPELR